MIPNARDRDLKSNVVSEEKTFGISVGDSAHIMVILRDTLYSDKVLAVLREYSANAWDAHRSIGKHDVPIEVTLPTAEEPTLKIRDHGPGISHDDVFGVFTQYGASTKRTDDQTVGMLGIGSKSGFAYSDSFTVTSWHGGTRRAYVAVLDDTNNGIMKLLDESPCGDETGIEIKISVEQGDVQEFQDKSKELFRHFVPRPVINVELPVISESMAASSDAGYLVRDGRRRWVAVMGCIPYEVSIEQINAGRKKLLPEYVNNISGVLYFKIGDLEINASREQLKYNDSTKKAVAEKIEEMVDVVVRDLLVDIEKSENRWLARLKAQVFNSLRLPIPSSHAKMDSTYVELPPGFSAKSFFFSGKKQNDKITGIAVYATTRLVIKDDNRTMRGFNLTSNDILVRRFPGKKPSEVESELKEVVEKLDVVGIPIVKLSTLAWSMPTSGPKIPTHAKDKNVFEWVGGHSYRGRGAAKNWKAVPRGRVATADDVFVVIEKFRADGVSNVESTLGRLSAFGVKKPTIYGYRTTKNRPVDASLVVGVELTKWLEKTWGEVFVSERKLAEKWLWSKNIEVGGRLRDTLIDALSREFGQDHPIASALMKNRRADRFVHRVTKRDWLLRYRMDDLLTHRPEDFRPEVRAVIEGLVSRYPMAFWLSGDKLQMNTENSNHLLHYVKMVDFYEANNQRREEPNVNAGEVHDDERLDNGHP